ncbi:MAG: hypothetical protein UW09_C0001G0219 [candidate division TM6 bacterium GW2011_GWF2_43_87]|nr:MAG: hypothetical protein UW09_C0001G0219 [candidate division TM6 bacterium GW2011_GWF2_43_87]
MVIIIDAFNVLKAGFGDREIGDIEIRHFLRRVVAYGTVKHHEMIVVFDGGSSSHSTRCFDRGILVIHSGYRQRADDEVMRLLSQYPPDNVVVVSSDREIVRYAASHRVVSIGAEGFKKLMYEAEREHESKGVALKGVRSDLKKRPGHTSTPELDVLMQKAAARMMVKNEDTKSPLDEDENRRGCHKLSKAERQLERVVKKL